MHLAECCLGNEKYKGCQRKSTGVLWKRAVLFLGAKPRIFSWGAMPS